MTRLKLLLLTLCCGPVLAQTAAPTSPPPTELVPLERELRSEPNVRSSVIEDDGSRIEELRVRGRTTRIVVTPKVGTTRGYEIITDDGARDVSDGLTGSRGAAGKRVWRVIAF